MELSQWIGMLESDEQGYARQCFRYHNGTNGNHLPDIPPGMSKARADVLRCHCQALNNGQTGRRKVDKTEPVSFRWTEEFKRELAFEASKLDITMSEYVLRCVNAGRPTVQAYPEMSKFFTKKSLQL